MGVEAYLARHKCTPAVAARVRRLNPTLTEGDMVRGLFHKPMSWRRAKAKLQRGERLSYWPGFKLSDGSICTVWGCGPVESMEVAEEMALRYRSWRKVLRGAARQAPLAEASMKRSRGEKTMAKKGKSRKGGKCK